jgi:hypothetical protein
LPPPQPSTDAAAIRGRLYYIKSSLMRRISDPTNLFRHNQNIKPTV